MVDTPIGDLTFVTDGLQYVCFWHPSNESFKSQRARPIASISTRLIKDKVDFELWQTEVKNRWLVTSATILGANVEDLFIQNISVGDTN